MAKTYTFEDANREEGVNRGYVPTRELGDFTEGYLNKFTTGTLEDAKNCLNKYNKALDISETFAKNKYPTAFTLETSDQTIYNMLKESFTNYANNLKEKSESMYGDVNSKVKTLSYAGMLGSGVGSLYGSYIEDSVLIASAGIILASSLLALAGKKKIAKFISEYQNSKIAKKLEVVDKFTLN